MEEALEKPKRKSIRANRVRVNLYLDPAVVTYYKAQAGEREFQSLINETLRAAMQKHEQPTRRERVEAVYGKYAHVKTSSDEFAKRKQQEIDLEG